MGPQLEDLRKKSSGNLFYDGRFEFRMEVAGIEQTSLLVNGYKSKGIFFATLRWIVFG